LQLAGHTYAFRDLPLERALDALEELGFTAVELWLGHLDSDVAVATAAARGLDVVAISAGGYYEGDGVTPARAVEAAQAVAAPRIVACVSPARLRDVVGSIPDSLELSVENHWDQKLARPDEVARAVRASARLGACLDTGHALLAGVRPERFARGLGPLLRHVHLKDARALHLHERVLGRRVRRRLLARPEPIPAGGGALDIARLYVQLVEVGFTGAVTAEDEGRDPRRSLAALRAAWAEATMAARG
jgi:inosose dehydratase